MNPAVAPRLGIGQLRAEIARAPSLLADRSGE
jgi:hypothetical protein